MLIMIGAAIAPIANYFSKRTRKHCSSETILGFRTFVALPVIGLFAWVFEPNIDYHDITKLSAMLAIIPMMTLFFAYLYLGEVLETRQLLGIVPVLVGGYL